MIMQCIYINGYFEGLKIVILNTLHLQNSAKIVPRDIVVSYLPLKGS